MKTKIITALGGLFIIGQLASCTAYVNPGTPAASTGVSSTTTTQSSPSLYGGTTTQRRTTTTQY